MSIAVSFDTVSIVFGDKPAMALPLMDAGQEPRRGAGRNRAGAGRA
jgi:ABC-type proline/glycine betaine transport system ATPase subunit